MKELTKIIAFETRKNKIAFLTNPDGKENPFKYIDKKLFSENPFSDNYITSAKELTVPEYLTSSLKFYNFYNNKKIYSNIKEIANNLLKNLTIEDIKFLFVNISKQKENQELVKSFILNELTKNYKDFEFPERKIANRTFTLVQNYSENEYYRVYSNNLTFLVDENNKEITKEKVFDYIVNNQDFFKDLIKFKFNEKGEPVAINYPFYQNTKEELVYMTESSNLPAFSNLKKNKDNNFEESISYSYSKNFWLYYINKDNKIEIVNSLDNINQSINLSKYYQFLFLKLLNIIEKEETLVDFLNDFKINYIKNNLK